MPVVATILIALLTALYVCPWFEPRELGWGRSRVEVPESSSRYIPPDAQSGKAPEQTTALGEFPPEPELLAKTLSD